VDQLFVWGDETRTGDPIPLQFISSIQCPPCKVNCCTAGLRPGNLEVVGQIMRLYRLIELIARFTRASPCKKGLLAIIASFERSLKKCVKLPKLEWLLLLLFVAGQTRPSTAVQLQSHQSQSKLFRNSLVTVVTSITVAHVTSKCPRYNILLFSC
jgi:hypothetical protein